MKFAAVLALALCFMPWINTEAQEAPAGAIEVYVLDDGNAYAVKEGKAIAFLKDFKMDPGFLKKLKDLQGGGGCPPNAICVPPGQNDLGNPLDVYLRDDGKAVLGASQMRMGESQQAWPTKLTMKKQGSLSNLERWLKKNPTPTPTPTPTPEPKPIDPPKDPGPKPEPGCQGPFCPGGTPFKSDDPLIIYQNYKATDFYSRLQAPN